MLISIRRSEHAEKLLLHSMLNPTKEQLKNKLGVKSGYRKQQAAHIKPCIKQISENDSLKKST